MLAAFCRDSEGDPLALLDLIRPQLVTVLFTNDVRLHDDERFGREQRGLVARVAPYADVVLIAPFEQRAPRRVDDAQTTSGSEVVTSKRALFLASDNAVPVTGTNIAPDTTIASVQSAELATLTTPATGTGVGELTIDGRREVEMQAEYRAMTKDLAASLDCAFVDLYDAWSRTVGPGWEAAHAAGLMVDGLHPTQLGHDDIAVRVTEALGIT
jgi:lysophospholipase L1-like esterase